jgi:hypothetical protein
MAYDSARGVTVLFGGGLDCSFFSPCFFGDTWEWNGTDWTQRFPATSPSARYSHAMAYDSVHGVTVLFGGANEPGYSGFSDTWEWNGTTWTQRSPVTSPSARLAHVMAYDAAHGLTVLFGGVDRSGTYVTDTWEWDGANWAQRIPAISPLGRDNPAMAYDSVRGVTVLFGGYNYPSYTYLGDTWTFGAPRDADGDGVPDADDGCPNDPNKISPGICGCDVADAIGFVGFVPPIGGADATGGSFAEPLRAFKLGSTIPVKFMASQCGDPLLTGIHTLAAVKYSSDVDPEPAIDATPTDAATFGNQFRLTDGEWHFNLSTRTGFSQGTWKLIATLSDGSAHYVWITIKK